jgi:NAD(P)-dependent dehydrogenase (short-subunit alcohol dehydrogenase family)
MLSTIAKQIRFKEMATLSSPRNAGKLAGKNVVLIGGTAGIGLAVARGALQEGARITISSSSSDKISKSVEQLRADFPSDDVNNIRGYKADLSIKTEIEGVVDGLLNYAANGSSIDHIVFTAGNSLSVKSLAECSMDDLDALLVVRFYGAVAVAKYAEKYMKRAKTSSITLTTGAQSYKPSIWAAPAIGCVVEGLMRGLALTLAPIRVNTVAPGFVKTDLSSGMPQAAIDKWVANTLVKDCGHPEDVAEAYLYFMKDNFVTGTELATNGGAYLV